MKRSGDCEHSRSTHHGHLLQFQVPAKSIANDGDDRHHAVAGLNHTGYPGGQGPWRENQRWRASLDLGDYAFESVGAAEILRGLRSGGPPLVRRPHRCFRKYPLAGPGLEHRHYRSDEKAAPGLAAGAALAMFRDDQPKRDDVQYQPCYTPGAG